MRFDDNINEKEYEEFVLNNSYSHFMQSYYFGQVMMFKNFVPHYVGLYDNNKLVAACCLMEKKLKHGYKYFYSPRGYIIDFNNYSLLDIFTDYIKKFAKKNKAVFVKIDPGIKRYDLDSEGNIIKDNINNAFDNLIKLGYRHTGFNKEFTNEQPRFTFRVNLDRTLDEVYSGIHATTRKILNKNNEYGLELYKGNVNDIDDFYDIMEQTAERDNLACYRKEYYRNFFDILNKHGMSELYFVKVNISKLTSIFDKKISDINNKICDLSNKTGGNIKKNENKINELKIELDKVIKDRDEIVSIKEKEVILSSIITTKYKDKVWTIHGGNAKILRWLNANYYLYYHILLDAKEDGFKEIDFFGCSGYANPPKSSSIYGLHNFKKRFGGEYIEFIGEFDLVVNEVQYLWFKTIVPLKRKIVKMRNRKR